MRMMIENGIFAIGLSVQAFNEFRKSGEWSVVERTLAKKREQGKKTKVLISDRFATTHTRHSSNPYSGLLHTRSVENDGKAA